MVRVSVSITVGIFRKIERTTEYFTTIQLGGQQLIYLYTIITNQIVGYFYFFLEIRSKYLFTFFFFFLINPGIRIIAYISHDMFETF